ncbi:hypothetical protein [Arsenicibacter rosenii]|uniref:Uncharacterized protein n=1 Tax=Arsenicibacter rosenii TaxID=1750698 RepID=A0A1S2VEW6_9BACT|nr:hypothetical protein [Arsenicibacter rosenii]OIN57252.1 hypothetical protein BLX24_21100 [Arsenicibacter rosenii]
MDYVYYTGNFPDTHLRQTFYLLTMDRNSFRFYAIGNNMYEAVRRGGTNDFFGAYQGVMPEFTNIENGYGVFGAYLRTKKDVVIP